MAKITVEVEVSDDLADLCATAPLSVGLPPYAGLLATVHCGALLERGKYTLTSSTGTTREG